MVIAITTPQIAYLSDAQSSSSVFNAMNLRNQQYVCHCKPGITYHRGGILVLSQSRKQKRRGTAPAPDILAARQGGMEAFFGQKHNQCSRLAPPQGAHSCIHLQTSSIQQRTSVNMSCHTCISSASLEFRGHRHVSLMLVETIAFSVACWAANNTGSVAYNSQSQQCYPRLWGGAPKGVRDFAWEKCSWKLEGAIKHEPR